MAEAMQEMVALAREIAWEQWPSAHDFPEREAAEAAALAAIQATTERVAALNARQSGEGERLREAAAGVLAHRVDGPTRGWLRDNRDSRAALDALAAALRATDDAGGAK